MVNNVVLEYLRVNRGNYKISELRTKIISSGYPKQDVDDALAELNKQSGGKTPEVHHTIKQINDTNLNIEDHLPEGMEMAKIIDRTDSVIGKVRDNEAPKKSKVWLLVMLSISVLLLIAVASAAVWWFYFMGGSVGSLRAYFS